MARRKPQPPLRFDVVNEEGGLTGIAEVTGRMITVRATKGGRGSRTTQLGASNTPKAMQMLAGMMLLELADKKPPSGADSA